MKNYLHIVLCLFIVVLTSCHNQSQKKNPDNYVVESIEKEVVSNEVHHLQTIESSASADFKGKTYSINVIRKADSQLPVVSDEQGVKYNDNRISLHIYTGGKELVNKDFTKQSFASYLEPSFLQHSILEGLVFDKVTEYGLMFAASVSYPESDLYVPFHVTVLPDGNLSIDKADMMDDYEPEAEPEKNK